MKVLGLDLSLRATGVCILEPAQADRVKITTHLLKREKVSGILPSIERLISITNDIIDIIDKNKILVVIIEAPAKNQKWQAAAIGELHGVVKAEIYKRFGIVPLVEQATKLRKHVIGHIPSQRTKKKDKKGQTVNQIDYGLIQGKRPNTTKKATIKDIIEYKLKEQGLTFPSQDEMDAYVAARFAWNSLFK